MKNWNWFNYFTGSFVFSAGVFFLFKPWFNYFYKMQENNLNFLQQSYFLVVVIMSVFLAEKIAKISKESKRILLTALFFAANFIFIYYLNWNLGYFSLYALIALISGYRFEMYFGGTNFNRDFSLVIVFLLLTLILNNRFNLGADFLNIIIIFVSGIALSVFFNFESSTHKNKFKVIFASISLAGGILFLAAILVPGTTEFAANILPYFLEIYDKLIDIFLIIIYPIIWLLGPLIKFINYLASKTATNQAEIEPQGSMSNSDLDKIIEQTSGKEISAGTNFWWLYVILGILLIYLSFKLWKLSKDVNEKGFSENRESIFDKEILKNNFKDFVSTAKDKLKRKKENNIYDKSSLIIKTREIYYHYLNYYSQFKNYHPSETPNDYLYLLLHNDYLINNKKDGKKITEIYNKARYKEQVSETDFQQIKKSWEEINQAKK